MPRKSKHKLRCLANLGGPGQTGICIICCGRSIRSNQKNADMTKFLVEQFLPGLHFQPEGNVIKFCKGCHALLDQGAEIQGAIDKLQVELEEVKDKVKSFVAASRIVKKEGEEVTESGVLYQNIREQLLTDFIPIENTNYEDANEIGGAPWMGMDFQGEDESLIDADVKVFGVDPLEETMDVAVMNQEESQNLIAEVKSETVFDTNEELNNETSTSLGIRESCVLQSNKSPRRKQCLKEVVSSNETVPVPPNQDITLYNCRVCNIKFLAQSELFIHHRQAHSSVSFFVCFVCQQQFPSLSERQSHMLSQHQRLPFSTASSTVTSSSTTNSESATSLNQEESNKVELRPTFLPRCEMCSKPFVTNFQLVDHMTKVHGIEDESKRCPQCKKLFKTRAQMRYHLKYVHEKTPGSFICDVCKKRFINMYKLRYHAAIHREERPFLCSECGKTFKTKTSLTIHNYTHDPDRWTKYATYKTLVQRRLDTEKRRKEKAAKVGSGGRKKGHKNKTATESLIQIPMGELSFAQDFVKP